MNNSITPTCYRISIAIGLQFSASAQKKMATQNLSEQPSKPHVPVLIHSATPRSFWDPWTKKMN